MTDVRPKLWTRLHELMALKPGWLDGQGVPLSPVVAARASLLINVLADWAGPLCLYPTLEGGIELEWDDGNLNHSIAIGPELRLNLQTIDREEHP
ncbi:hypothetical protein [Kitasatospora sp. NPDC086791]|uniref:hypothetical protein n=1 Tax=Kitasatospora sp. NPDC086791 TaxID=3155178 RepID=UPI00341B2245